MNDKYPIVEFLNVANIQSTFLLIDDFEWLDQMKVIS